MSLVFGPKKLGIGITNPSQVTVVELVNGLPSSTPVDFTAPVTVTSNGISFEVAEAGRYRVTAKNPYASESVTVDLSPDLPYTSDIQSKVDYLVSTGGSGDGAVISVNGKAGVVVLTASDVSARPASWVPSWTDVTGKPGTFTPSTHTHSAAQVTSGTLDITRLPVADDGVSSSTAVVRADDSRLSGGGGGGDVVSVNGQTGVVVLDAADVGARADDWNPDLSEYVTDVDLITGLTTNSTGDRARANHTGTQAISTVTGLQAALDGKQASGSYATGAQGVLASTAVQPGDLSGYATTTALTDASTADRARANHTGTQAISTVTGLQTALDGKQAAGSYASAAQGALADTAVQPSALTPIIDELDTKAEAGIAGLVPGSSLHVYWDAGWPTAPTARTDIAIFWHGGSSADPAPLRENIDVWIKEVE